MRNKIRASGRPSNARAALAMQEKVKAGLTMTVGLSFMLVLLWFLGGTFFLILGLAFTAAVALAGLLVSAIWVRVSAARRQRRREVRQRARDAAAK